MERYYLICNRQLGKEDDDGDWLYQNGVWEKDTNWEISDRLIGFDASEPEDSPYRIGCSSVMDEICEITKEEAEAIIRSQQADTF